MILVITSATEDVEKGYYGKYNTQNWHLIYCMFYVLALQNSTQHCVAPDHGYLCCLQGRVNLMIVSALHLVL